MTDFDAGLAAGVVIAVVIAVVIISTTSLETRWN
jgi:tetrahydromethanopterin S-methyltransferase subunit F